MNALHQLAVNGGTVEFSDLVTPTSFWRPNLLVRDSAWIEHGPFAFWIVDAMRPKTIVELGCFSGYSYFAFCQAVQALGLDTQCHAVDTWQGDEHTGFYDDHVYMAVNAHNQAHYPDFSTLVRAPFDDALQYFSDGTVDLLHIDGMHTYDAVKADFLHWRPKLSSRAVVIFHDINVRERGFGVARLWEELSAEFKSFGFVHGHGLGIIGVGDNLPAAVNRLFESSADPDLLRTVRLAYSRLGKSISDDMARAAFESAAADRDGRAKRLEVELGRQIKMQNYLVAVASQHKAELEARKSELETRKTELEGYVSDLQTQIAAHNHEAEHLRQRVESMYRSTSWRVTAPLRHLARMLQSNR